MEGYNVDLRLEKHPEKTFIGRIERGFDFLGHHFGAKGLTAARETLNRFVSRATRLYEQEPGEPYGSPGLGCTLNVGFGGYGRSRRSDEHPRFPARR